MIDSCPVEVLISFENEKFEKLLLTKLQFNLSAGGYSTIDISGFRSPREYERESILESFSTLDLLREVRKRTEK